MPTVIVKRRFNAPRNHFRKRRSELVNTIAIFDVSWSMSGPVTEGSHSKIEAGKEALRLTIRHRQVAFPNDRIGIVAFHDQATVISPLLCPQDARLRASVDKIACGGGGGTALESGLKRAIPMLLKRPRRFRRSIILISDGQPTTPRHRAIRQAQRAARHRIKVHTIGVAGEGSDFDEAFLRKVATISGGGYEHVDSLKALAHVLRHVG